VVQIGQELPESKAYIWVKAIDPNAVDKIKAQIPAKHFWDVCDPAWWWEPKGSKEIARKMDGIVASSHALANDFIDFSGLPRKVNVIPDRIDLDHYPIRRVHVCHNPVRMIWFGASQNRISLFAGIANLERLVTNGLNIELTIFDDSPSENWRMTDKFTVYFTPWDLETENKVIAAHDIAILPPYPGAWGRVKSNNKVLTAWACGLPASDAQDFKSLMDLASVSANRQRDADEGQKLLEKDYDIRKSAKEWVGLIDG
jgi:glycosyltransferase involved in cell wall biosynthesis